MLRDMAREYLSDRLPSARVRELMESETAHDETFWGEIAEMGWQAMAIPEEYGGAGFTFQELGIVLEEMGRFVAPGPFFSTVVLGANAILLGGTEEQKRAYLPRVAAGEHRLAFAPVDSGSGWSLDDVTTKVHIDGDTATITGTKEFVVDGHTADTLIVAARDGDENVDFWIVSADTSGVTSYRVETLDMTRKQAVVSFKTVPLKTADRLGVAGSGKALMTSLYDIAGAALAYESVGGGPKMPRDGGRVCQGSQAIRPGNRLVPSSQTQMRRHVGAGRVGKVVSVCCGVGSGERPRGIFDQCAAREVVLRRRIFLLRR